MWRCVGALRTAQGGIAGSGVGNVVRRVYSHYLARHGSILPRVRSSARPSEVSRTEPPTRAYGRPFNPFNSLGLHSGGGGGSSRVEEIASTPAKVDAPGGSRRMKDFDAKDFHPGDGSEPHTVLIDGTSLIIKAYSETPQRKNLIRSDGQHLNAVYRCTTILLSLVRNLEPQGIALMLDHRLPESIQGDEDLLSQIPIVCDAAEALGITVIRTPGFTSEDSIASHARILSEAGHNVTVVSPQITRLVQLVADGVVLYDLVKGKVIDVAEVARRYNVPPPMVPAVQSLIGAPDLGIEGVAKIGVKTASALIKDHHGLPNLLNSLDDMKASARRTNLKDKAPALLKAHSDLSLHRNIPQVLRAAQDDTFLPSLQWQALDVDQVIGFLEDMEFRRLLSQFAQENDPDLRAMNPELVVDGMYDTLTTVDSVQHYIQEACASGHTIAICLFTSTGEDGHNHPVVGMSLAHGDEGKGVYIPFGHYNPAAEAKATEAGGAGAGEGAGEVNPDTHSGVAQVTQDEALRHLLPLLADPTVPKTTFDAKLVIKLLKTQFNATVRNLHDVSIMSYIVKCGAMDHHILTEIVRAHLGIPMIELKLIVGVGQKAIPWAAADVGTAGTFAGQRADVILRLHKHLQEEMQSVSSLQQLYNDIEHPLITTIADMEMTGVYCDRGALNTLLDEYAKRMNELQQEIWEAAGAPINISSPRQLGNCMFESMPEFQGKGVVKGKNGDYSTSSKVLLELAKEGYQFAQNVLDYREVSKLHNTYCKGLLDAINPRTDRIHTTFLQAGTSTGRLSSIEPNLQNIPVRTAAGRRLRACFTAKPGHQLVFADYSQMELRMLAHIAEIDALKEAFADGTDVHRLTASQVFDVPPDQVDSVLRQRAKTINFGIIYGMSEYGLRANLGVTLEDARDYIASYFKQYPGIQRYMDRMKSDCRKNGYVTTMFGRRCWIPEIHDKNPNKRQIGERAAINTPIQGSSADIAKIAMLRMHDKLQRENMQSRLILQVHDELILESPDEEVDELKDMVKWEMEHAVSEEEFTVKMEVDVSASRTWEK